MKDITRIHIAKVPYNIELSAKKELEKYITTLEAYTSDVELLEDIEIRMTELLLERGVKQDDVISEADITAVREQLGEPKDFMADDMALEIDGEILSQGPKRKLYRNLNIALVGGVLSGIASYFHINVLWARVIFIVLSFISFGVSVLLYIVLWLIIPPARTAAEKLQMEGRPVTLASIRALNEGGSNVEEKRRTKVRVRIATIVLGVVSIAAAMTVVAALVAVNLSMVKAGQIDGVRAFDQYQPAIALAFAAGVLLFMLCILVAIAGFTQKFNKRIWISGIIVIILGLSSFVGAAVLATYQSRTQYEAIQRNTVETTVKMPEKFGAIKSLSVDVPSTTSVVYVADDSITSIKQRSLKDAPKATVTVENGSAKVRLAPQKQPNPMASTILTIYGPRLDSIIVSNGYASYSGSSQANLNTEVYNSASLRLIGARIDTLKVKTDAAAQFSAYEAAVSAVEASLYGQSSISLGNIKKLTVTHSEVCASNQAAQLSVDNIFGATYTRNGNEMSAKSLATPCLNVQFARDQASLYGNGD